MLDCTGAVLDVGLYWSCTGCWTVLKLYSNWRCTRAVAGAGPVFELYLYWSSCRIGEIVLRHQVSTLLMVQYVTVEEESLWNNYHAPCPIL